MCGGEGFESPVQENSVTLRKNKDRVHGLRVTSSKVGTGLCSHEHNFLVGVRVFVTGMVANYMHAKCWEKME